MPFIKHSCFPEKEYKLITFCNINDDRVIVKIQFFSVATP